jgi:hypothetical protein
VAPSPSDEAKLESPSPAAASANDRPVVVVVVVQEATAKLSSESESAAKDKAAEVTAPMRRRKKPKVDPLVATLKEIYHPTGLAPEHLTDMQVLGKIEAHSPELEDKFSEDSVLRARELIREEIRQKSQK